MPVRLPLLIAMVFIFLTAPAAPPDSAETIRESGRELTAQFAAALKNELTRTIEQGGPASAIGVCRDRAPLIAGELARENGVKIGRTSLRFRNPQNAPADWQRPVLERFDRFAPEAGEWVQLSPTANVAARYMKAIGTQPLCLACHGTPEGTVSAELEQTYPFDRATGYAVGDIRGAFYVEWPLPPRPTPVR